MGADGQREDQPMEESKQEGALEDVQMTENEELINQEQDKLSLSSSSDSESASEVEISQSQPDMSAMGKYTHL